MRCISSGGSAGSARLDRRAALLGMAALPAAGPTEAAVVAESLRLGVFPYLPPLALDRQFAPVMHSLGEAVHRPVFMRTRGTIRRFEAALVGHAFDFAFVHPFMALRAIESYGYTPMVRVDSPFRLAFLARADDGFTGLEDLRSKTLVAPPTASAAFLLTRLTLLRNGLRPGRDLELVPMKSKMATAHKVLRGEAAACALPVFAIRQLGFDREPRLTPFHGATLPVCLSVIAAPRLEAPTAERVGRELLDWSVKDEGRAILRHCGWPGFVEASSADYDPLRQALCELDGFMRS